MSDVLLDTGSSPARGRGSRHVAAAWKLLQVGGIAAACVASVALYDQLKATPQASSRAAGLRKAAAAMPIGVNVGGWLCLEDWFYSSDSGRHVMSNTPKGQGSCLPPAVLQTEDSWPSEGILTERLIKNIGEQGTIEAFRAHRSSFIGNQDLRDMASLGIRKVRVPLTWAAFADALTPIDDDIYGKHNPDSETVLVPDPFYPDMKFATVPRDWLKEFLFRCSANGLQVLFDLHAFPGGSSDGTYNGVWPSRPAFWRQNATLNTKVSLQDAGLWVAQALVRWVEELPPTYRIAVAGVSLMNEPAHMAAFEHNDPSKDFANEMQVLNWLAASAEFFRSSSLPTQGMKLYVQIIETAFKDFDGTVGPWYNSTFTSDEQRSWAILDRHWYVAWSNGGCDGRTNAGGAFNCDDNLETIRAKLRGCINGFTKDFAAKYPGKKATSEFSIGTFEDARFACNDKSVGEVFLEEQLAAFAAADIEPFFWTWRMPHGKVFEPGWSLKHIAGLETQTAEVCKPAMTASSLKPPEL